MKYLSLLLFVFVGFGASAQFAASPGYIITNEGEKQMGKITINTPAINSVKIVFKNDETGEKNVYKPFTIKGWGSEDGVYYESKAYQMGMKNFGVFMRRMSDGTGPVQCYKYWNTDGMNGYAQIFLDKDQELTEVRFGKFKKQMAEYFKGCDGLPERIEAKEFSKNLDGLLKLAEAYNVCRGSDWD